MTGKAKTSGLQGEIRLAGGRVGVLLVHGLAGNPIELRFLAHGLARQGYTVHCPVIPGMTFGTDVLGLSRWQDWYRSLETAYEELAAKCDTVIVGGLSVGSLLAMRLAAKRPEGISGLMVFAPTFWPNGWAIPKALYLFKLVQQHWLARMFRFHQRPPYGIKDERIRNFVIESFKSDERPIEDLFGRGGGLVFEFKQLAKDVRKSLARIKQETAIFHPREDDQSALWNALTLQRRLGGLVECTVLDDCYHMVTLDRQRSLVVDRAVDFAVRLTQKLEEKAAVKELLKGKGVGESA